MFHKIQCCLRQPFANQGSVFQQKVLCIDENLQPLVVLKFYSKSWHQKGTQTELPHFWIPGTFATLGNREWEIPENMQIKRQFTKCAKSLFTMNKFWTGSFLWTRILSMKSLISTSLVIMQKLCHLFGVQASKNSKWSNNVNPYVSPYTYLSPLSSCAL